MCIARKVIVPDYPLYCGQHVWETSKGVFTYSDETERFVDEKYTSFEDAVDAMHKYADWLCYGPN